MSNNQNWELRPNSFSVNSSTNVIDDKKIPNLGRRVSFADVTRLSDGNVPCCLSSATLFQRTKNSISSVHSEPPNKFGLINHQEEVELQEPVIHLLNVDSIHRQQQQENENKNNKNRNSQVRFSSVEENTSFVNEAFVPDEEEIKEEDDDEFESFDPTEEVLNEHWLRDDDENDDDSSECDWNLEQKPTKAWDSFDSIPMKDEDQTLNSEWSKFWLKILKLFFYGLTFTFVLVFGVIAKLTFHLIANMTRVNKTVINCNRKLVNVLDYDKNYHSLLGLTSPERIGWIWMLYFVTIMPEVLTLVRSLKIFLFKHYKMPDLWCISLIFATHSSEVLGVSFFAYLVLPSLDIISGLVFTNSLFVLPCFCLMKSVWQKQNIQGKQKKQSCQLESGKAEVNDNTGGRQNTLLYFRTIAFCVQLASLVAWPLLFYWADSKFEPIFGTYSPRDELHWITWGLPLSGILISLGYWENFIDDKNDLFDGTEEKSFKFKILKKMIQIKNLPIVSKYAINLWVSLWKCLLYFAMMLLIQMLIAYKSRHEMADVRLTLKRLFADFGHGFGHHQVEIVRENTHLTDTLTIAVNGWPIFTIGFIHMASAFICHITIHFVCKICIQPFSFALPTTLILPVGISLMNWFVNFYLWHDDHCFFANISKSFEYIFWNVHYNVFEMNESWKYFFVLLWLLTFTSQVITVSHIWISSKERLVSSDQLFARPHYTVALFEQSIMLSRRLDDDTFANNVANSDHDLRPQQVNCNDTDSYNSGQSFDTPLGNENKIRIYACATVWHETSDELMQMLKSVLRMDQDQATRRLAVKWLNVEEQQADYYEFENDAFCFGQNDTNDNCNNRYINQYVKTLIDVLDKAASNVHQRTVEIKPPRIFSTPYGGRLEWRLPGSTKLITHMKDKLKIRHRKRWSQVMYMYYLLGYKVYEKEKIEEKRAKLLNNTFILALDGDINFRPEAVLLLVDLMRKDKNLGAACGRIHPVGSGLMAWYQLFEYAISHWLQKATEHVFGCVLCSPGCFSLFRAAALVDQNVMHRYTTRPTEAIHYVQYDQGEDRWLCTLMLQQGWRVEYSAASDAYTHCPESFGEFYIQRRRWAPSTMANIIDLLRNYKYTVEKNDNISSLYIAYQAALMLGTILSPGTIFLMLISSMNTAFNFSSPISFCINIIPVLIFILICFVCKTNIQLLVAQILSTIYAMLMLAVLVSMFIEIKEKTALAPSVLFFEVMASVFVLAALIHPQEFICLLSAPLYLLTIPSMYLFLTIYSIINLHIVTWGTRETPQPQNSNSHQQQQSQKDANFLTNFGNYLRNSAKWDLKLMCCASYKNEEELYYLRNINESLGKMNMEMHDIQAQIGTLAANNELKRKNLYRRSMGKNISHDVAENEPLLQEEYEQTNEYEALNTLDSVLEDDRQTNQSNEQTNEQVDPLYPSWVQDESLANGRILSIKNDEQEFWVEFIEKYLKPLDEDKSHQKKVKEDLIDLRNKAVFTFGIINIIFVLFVFLLQIHKDMFSITFTLKSKQNGTTEDPLTGVVIPYYDKTTVDMDPIGLVLILFFGIILIIQCIGMFLHRLGTLAHLLAFTEINFFEVKEEDVRDHKIVNQNAVAIARFILEKNTDDMLDDESKHYNMEKEFKRKFFSTKTDVIAKGVGLPRAKSAAKELLQRRNTARRMSLMIQSEQLLRLQRLAAQHIINSDDDDGNNRNSDSETVEHHSIMSQLSQTHQSIETLNQTENDPHEEEDRASNINEIHDEMDDETTSHTLFR